MGSSLSQKGLFSISSRFDTSDLNSFYLAGFTGHMAAPLESERGKKYEH